MIIKNDKPHLGDALMILAMMQDEDIYVGTSNCNALLMNNIKTIPVEHCIYWDIDVSDITYSDWDGYAEAINIVWDKIPAKLIVSKDELANCKFPDSGGKKRVGICCWSRDKHRGYPHWKVLVKQLSKYYETHVFGLQQLPIRQLIAEVSQMDLMVSVDTGIAHIAGSFDIPLIIIEGPTDCKNLYSCYKDVKYVSTGEDRCSYKPCVKGSCNHINCMYLLRPLDIVRVSIHDNVVLPQASNPPRSIHLPAYTDEIALLRLDGLGGTVTLADHAKKAKKKYNKPITLITRGYEDVFIKNPYIDNVISVGVTEWQECLNAMKNRFWALADIRFAIAKWYGEISQDFSEWENIYNGFGLDYNGYNDLVENSNLHHVQLTDKLLGLPYNVIDTEIYSWSDNKVLSEDYACVNNGVDVIHGQQLQTKSWYYWRELVGLFNIPVVQVGTRNDLPIVGTIDMRGKTTIPELCGILKHAKNIVCVEGGIMHLAYALRHSNTTVIQGPTRGKMFEYPGQKIVASYLCKACVFTKPDWYLRCYADANAVCMKSITPWRVYETVVAD